MKNVHAKTRVGIFTHDLNCAYHGHSGECDCSNMNTQGPDVKAGEHLIVFARILIDEAIEFFVVLTSRGITSFYTKKGESNLYLDVLGPADQSAVA